MTGVILSLTLLRRGEDKSDAKGLGPEETIGIFCQAIASGDFERARALCDTMTMKSYIETYSEAWNMLQKQDSCSLGIASGILSEMKIEIEDAKKEGNKRSIFFTIDAGNGMVKKKTATVRKIEGEWKVQEIKDR